MGIYEQLAAEHAERERAQRERAQQMAAMAAREAAMREAAMRAQAQQAQLAQEQLAQAQHAAARAAATHAATQRAAAQRATGTQAGQYPGYQNSHYQQPPGPAQNFAPQPAPIPTAPGYNPAALTAPAPGYPAQFAPPAPSAHPQSAPNASRPRRKLFGAKRRQRKADANQLANRVVGNVANAAQPALMAPPSPPGLQQSAPQPPAPAPASSAPAPAQSQAPLPAAPAAAAAAPTDAPASAIKRFKALSIKRSPKPKAPIPAPADKNTEHNLAHYKSLPTVGPENVDALHLMAVGTSIWALAAVGLSILLGATASRSAALEICLCGIVIGVIGMAWGGVHEYRKALGRGPLSEDNSTPVDDVAAGEALSLRYRDI